MNTRQVLCTIGFALATSAGDAWSSGFWDGNKLLEHMRSNDQAARGLALGYVMGVVDTGHGTIFCPPSNTTAGQMQDMVRQHLENVPAARHLIGSAHVGYILRESWPCANNNAPKPPASRTM